MSSFEEQVRDKMVAPDDEGDLLPVMKEVPGTTYSLCLPKFEIAEFGIREHRCVDVDVIG